SFNLFFYTDPPPTGTYTLSLHDALPIYACESRSDETLWIIMAASEQQAPVGEKGVRAAVDIDEGVVGLHQDGLRQGGVPHPLLGDRKSTRLNSSHDQISYAVFCLKKKKK